MTPTREISVSISRQWVIGRTYASIEHWIELLLNARFIYEIEFSKEKAEPLLRAGFNQSSLERLRMKNIENFKWIFPFHPFIDSLEKWKLKNILNI